MSSYRPDRFVDNGPPPVPSSLRETMYRFNANQNPPPSGPRNASGSQPRRNDFPHRRPGLSSRPLLRQKQNAEAIQMFRDPAARDRFRDVENLTDSDEDMMEESEDDEGRPSKKQRIGNLDGPITSVAKAWSNPDPYTALPPPEEGVGKRLDVVKLIRKAKIDDDASKPSSLADNEDFISFDTLDDLFPGAPTEPKADRPGGGLGKRSRGDGDARPRPPGGYGKRHGDNLILPAWQSSVQSSPTPWLSAANANETAAVAYV